LAGCGHSMKLTANPSIQSGRAANRRAPQLPGEQPAAD
jgi:hypothetical protein